MNILLITGNWFTCSKPGGGEFYLSRLVESIKPYGHKFKGISFTEHPFTHNDIEFYPQGDMMQLWTGNNDLFKWADVVFTQLLGNPYAYNKCKQHNKPMVFFAHNTAKHYVLSETDRVVYNSHSLGKIFHHKSFTLPPIIPNYTPYQISNRKYIAMVNCNKIKGVETFNQLASELPYPFLGIKGAYGEQILSDHVTYLEHGETIDWSEIKLLLVPSEIESWSQVASEAMKHGIPVICSPLPGLKENLSYAGIYIEPKDISLYKETIRWLMESEHIYKSQSNLCLKRGCEYKSDVSEFNNWLMA